MKHYNFSPILFFLTILLYSSCTDKTTTQTNAANYSELVAKAMHFQKENKLDSAYYYFNLSKNTVPKNSDHFAYVQFEIANLQHFRGDFAGCEETVTETLATYSGTTYLPYFYNILASSYYRLEDVKSALNYYQKAYQHATVAEDRLVYQNNIGLMFLKNREYPKAAQHFEMLLKEELLLAQKSEYARVQDNLGYCQFKLNLPSAIYNLENAWQLRDSLQDNIGLIASNMHLSEYYEHTDRPLAKSFAEKAYAVSLKTNSPDDQLEALKWLTTFGNPDESKQFYQHYIHLSDSLTKTRSIAKNQFSKIKYDSKKATQEVIKYKNQKIFLLALIGLLIIIVFLLYLLYQAKNKRKLLQSTYQTETRISKRIHDELANDVFNAMTFAQTQNLDSHVAKNTLLDNLEQIYNRTRDISKENSDIRTDENFEPDVIQMCENYSDQYLNVIRKISPEINWQKISPEKKITIYRILQELLINTKKHSQANLVVIDFSEQNHTLVISYSDNGIGLHPIEKRKSGLQNAENRIMAINGKLIFDTVIQNGFKATLLIPK